MNIPHPKIVLEYTVRTPEDFAKLRFIDLLWIVDIDTYSIAGRGLGMKLENFQLRIDKNPNQEKQILNELEDWVKMYTHRDDSFWLFMEKSYEKTTNDFIKSLIEYIELSQNSPSFGNISSIERQKFLKKVVNSRIFNSVKSDIKPTLFDFLDLTFLLKEYIIAFNIEDVKFFPLAINLINIYISTSLNDNPRTLLNLQCLMKTLLRQHTFEIYTHYLLSWMNQAKVFEKVFPSLTTEITINENLKSNTEDANQINSMTESQRVLTIHYFLKFLNSNYKNAIDSTVIAGWILMISGKRVSVIKNSDTYKKIRKAPNLKSDKSLINDLIVVKLFFETIGFKEVIQSIDNEIDNCNEELNRED